MHEMIYVRQTKNIFEIWSMVIFLLILRQRLFSLYIFLLGNLGCDNDDVAIKVSLFASCKPNKTVQSAYTWPATSFYTTVQLPGARYGNWRIN